MTIANSHRQDACQSRESTRDSGQRAHILVVDDTRDTQLLFAAFLRRSHVSVAFAEHGQEAFEKAIAAQQSGRPFDVILMDVRMPVLDGCAATRKLRNTGYKGTIIAHSANTATNDREMCLRAGCDDYFTKPLLQATFMQLVSRHLPVADGRASTRHGGRER